MNFDTEKVEYEIQTDVAGVWFQLEIGECPNVIGEKYDRVKKMHPNSNFRAIKRTIIEEVLDV